MHQLGDSNWLATGMNAVPPSSRRVLADLRAETFVTIDHQGRGTTPVSRAYARLDATLEAHTTAFVELDRIEAAVVAMQGYPRVLLPGTAGEFAADAATLDRRVPDRARARRLKRTLRQRQLAFDAAAAAAGLVAAQQRAAITARDLSEAVAALLLAPAPTLADLALKLVVLIAAGEPGIEDAKTFPWAHLRTLLADLSTFQPEGPLPS